ncbi:MAG: hypothetical protein AAGE52_16480 [Myxococcota bacterium]
MVRLVPLILLLSACGASYVVDTEQELFLLTNLRPNARGDMTSVLGWRGTSVLPACTKVQLTDVGSREVRFRDANTGQRYRYLLHRSARTNVEEHINRYFGSACPNLSAYAPVDQQGIQQGVVLPGMSREAVVIALGYPPEHRTPTLEQATWTYWGERGHVEVTFSGDHVASINDPSRPAQPQPQAQPQAQPQPQTQPQAQPQATVTVTANANGYPTQAAPGYPVQGTATATATVDANGYPVQTQPVQPAPQQTTVHVQGAAPQGSATVTVQTTNNGSRRARRRRRRRRAAVGVAVGATVAAGAAAQHQANRQNNRANRRQSNPPRQTRTVSRRRSTRRTSGCQTLTINGTRYTDHHGTPMGQNCNASSGGAACPAGYVCVAPLAVCAPQERERCRE